MKKKMTTMIIWDIKRRRRMIEMKFVKNGMEIECSVAEYKELQSIMKEADRLQLKEDAEAHKFDENGIFIGIPKKKKIIVKKDHYHWNLKLDRILKKWASGKLTQEEAMSKIGNKTLDSMYNRRAKLFASGFIPLKYRGNRGNKVVVTKKNEKVSKRAKYICDRAAAYIHDYNLSRKEAMKKAAIDWKESVTKIAAAIRG
jgi:hypothetical protein